MVGRSLAGAQGASEGPQRIAHRPTQTYLLNPRSRVGAGKQLAVLVFFTEHVPLFALLAAAMGLSAYLENHFKWLLAFATAWSLMLAIAIPWYRWAYPRDRAQPFSEAKEPAR